MGFYIRDLEIKCPSCGKEYPSNILIGVDNVVSFDLRIRCECREDHFIFRQEYFDDLDACMDQSSEVIERILRQSDGYDTIVSMGYRHDLKKLRDSLNDILKED